MRKGLFSGMMVAGLLLTGCANGFYAAPFGSQFTMDSDIMLAPSEAYYFMDSIGSLVITQASVMDDQGLNLMPGIQVEIATSWPGLYLLPESAVKMVDYPEPGEGVTSPEEAQALCDTDDDGYIDEDAEDWCSWWWDTESGQYYEFGTDYASTDTNYRPNYLITGSDDRGLVRFYVYIDSMPAEQDEDGAVTWGEAQIWGSIGVSSDTMNVSVETTG